MEYTVAQVLTSILHFGMDPCEASVAPRLFPIRSDYVIEIESRLPPPVVSGLVRLGVRVSPLPPYHWPLGSFQVCWRDAATGELRSSADPRRAGKAAGF